MAKRFIDTGLFDDPWFMDLSIDGKIFWIYCITKCDHAGIIEINKKLAVFQTGINSLDTVIEELGNRLVRVTEHIFFIPKFLEFQYPGFPNSKVRQQQSAVSILTKYGFISDGKLTVNKELGNYYGNGNDNGTVVIKEESNLLTNAENFDFEIIKKNEKWLETVFMNARLSEKANVTPERYNELVNLFISEQKLSGIVKNEMDYKNHFINWIKVQFKKPVNQKQKLSMP